jgi:hypothetical protein
MAGVEVSISHMSGIDDGATSSSDGKWSGQLHRAMEVSDIVSAGVSSAGIG